MTTGHSQNGGPRGRRVIFSPLTIITALAAIGILGVSAVFVATGFVLDEKEKALANALGIAPNGRPMSLEKVLEGDWSDVCVLNTQIADPGKIKAPPKMPGMLIPPMRHHANFLTAGFWVIVTLDEKENVVAEYRVDPDHIANLSADNGGNFCAPRAETSFMLKACEQECKRKIVFSRGAS